MTTTIDGLVDSIDRTEAVLDELISYVDDLEARLASIEQRLDD